MDIQVLGEITDKFAAGDYSERFRLFLAGFLGEAYGLGRSLLTPDVTCFVNAQANTYTFQGRSEVNNIGGAIQLSPGRVGRRKGKPTTVTKTPDCGAVNFAWSEVLYDSCAFTDVLTQSRITPELALERQLVTLDQLPQMLRLLLVSYDLLIDEKHVNGTRIKQRWSVKEGEEAVKATVDAAKYLDSQRYRLDGYELVMSCQGVDAGQYQRCVAKVLEFCQPNDVLGLGGWCILGRQKSYLPTFWEAMRRSLPLIAEAGLKKVHIFGVTWYKPTQGFIPPLPVLLHECDRLGLTLSTDGTSPIGNALWKNWKRAGATFPYWRHNLAWVKTEMATLRDSEFYREIPMEKVSVSVGDRVLYNNQRCQVEKVGTAGAYKNKAKLLTADFEELWIDVDRLDVPGVLPQPTTTPKTLTTVSLFSGMGGVDAGFKMAGFNPVASVEFDEENQEYSKDCERSHLINFPDAKFYLEPVQGVAGKLPKCDILQTSPVCAHFSAAANMVGGMREEQAEDLEMARATVQALRDCSPRYFMLEQVPGYVDSQSFEAISQALETNGYRYDYKILDLADYGVPQNRKRLILLAGRDRVWEFPKEQRRVGWKEAIAGIQLEPCTLTRRQQLQLIKQVADYDLSQGLLIQRIGMNIVVRRHNEPCFTITRSMFVDEKGASRSKVATVINSQGIWNLPLRAIARLCGFPDWFHLGKYAGQGLGYAVPPKFVKLLCSSLISD